MNSILSSIANICGILTIPLTILVIIIFVLKRSTKNMPCEHWLVKTTCFLRKIHIPLGVALLGVSLFHSFFSTRNLLHWPWGLASLASLVLCCASYLLCKVKGFKFLTWHRILTLIFLLTFAIHLVEAYNHQPGGHEHQGRGRGNHSLIHQMP